MNFLASTSFPKPHWILFTYTQIECLKNVSLLTEVKDDLFSECVEKKIVTKEKKFAYIEIRICASLKIPTISWNGWWKIMEWEVLNEFEKGWNFLILECNFEN